MITSTSNNRIKNVIKCIKSAKERKKQDAFVVEGIRMFMEIPSDMHMETYVTEEFYKKNRQVFEERREYFVECVSPHVMEAMADTKTPQGVISLVKQFHYSIEEIMGNVIPLEEGIDREKDSSKKIGNCPVVIALENLQDPGNLGTIVRTAEAAGMTGIVMSSGTADIYNPKVVRATMGSVFRMPFCYVTDFADWLKESQRKGFFTYGAHLDGQIFYEYDFKSPTVFCIGNEGNGLSKEALKVVGRRIRIPMEGRVESLNAATAATVLMYEAVRQRYKQFRQN